MSKRLLALPLLLVLSGPGPAKTFDEARQPNERVTIQAVELKATTPSLFTAALILVSVCACSLDKR